MRDGAQARISRNTLLRWLLAAVVLAAATFGWVWSDGDLTLRPGSLPVSILFVCGGLAALSAALEHRFGRRPRFAQLFLWLAAGGILSAPFANHIGGLPGEFPFYLMAGLFAVGLIFLFVPFRGEGA